MNREPGVRMEPEPEWNGPDPLLVMAAKARRLVPASNIAEAVAVEREKAKVIRDLWVRGFREASWGHGRACNIHTKEAPGTGCSCVFGLLNAAIVYQPREDKDWHHRCDIAACNCNRCHHCGLVMPEIDP